MACPIPRRTHSMHTFTGAAQIWLVVNIPATVAGTSEKISARSRFFPFSEPLPVPRRLMSQKIPVARNPCGATTEPEIGVSFMLLQQAISCVGSGVNQQILRYAMRVALQNVAIVPKNITCHSVRKRHFKARLLDKLNAFKAW